MPPQPRTRAPVFAVLHDSGFRAIWYLGMVQEVSRRLELLTLSWFILQTTDSPFQLGLILVFNNVPRPLFSLFSGLIADRISRHRILALAQVVNTATVLGILLLIAFDQLSPWHAFVAVFLQGVTKVLEDPSRRTAILDIVGEGRLVNALALDQMSNTGGKMAGPLLFGVLVGTSGFQGAYVVALVLHLLTLALLTRLHIPRYRGSSSGEPVWRSLGVGIRYALRSPMLMGLLYVTLVMNALGFPVQQFIPAIGRDYLDVGAALVGLLVAAEGFGQMLGAAMMSLTRNLRHHGLVYLVGSLVVLVMALLFPWSPWYGLAFALLTIGGIGQAGFGTMQSAITMLATPREMRGRMMGVLSLCIGSGTPLGTLEMGAVAATFSTQWAISLNALAGLLLVLPVLALTPLVRRPLAQPPPAVAPG